MKKVLAILLLFITVTCGITSCSFNEYDAVVINGGYSLTQEWSENNIVAGSFTQNPEIYIIEDQEHLNVIFDDFPKIDFEKETVIVHRSMTVYSRRYYIKSIFLDGDKLYIELDNFKNIFGLNSATAPRTELTVIRMKKMEIREVEFIFD